MKINDMTNLFVGHNDKEDFTVLICALDTIEAKEIANTYAFDTNLKGEFVVSEYKGNEEFDCDYILS